MIGARGVLLLFSAATFASAFLIFEVQPLVGKRILAWFGGAPGVWTLCLAFYQTTLFAGYAYAHASIRLLRPGAQLAVHALASAAALIALPVLPEEAWRPAVGGTSAPSVRILAMLAANLGPPLLVLAATGPLLQAWFAALAPGRSPYPLYAVSNLGSLLAVAAYPLWIEPRFGVLSTGRVWSWSFAATAAVVALCALLTWRATGAGAAASPVATAPGGRPRARDAAHWLALAGAAVMLLMGVTNQLCLDVASVPFLWMLPLGVYLLSFILCFGSERSYRRAPYLVIAGAALFLPELGRLYGELPDVAPSAEAMPAHILRYVALLFGGCMLLHGELYRLRPPPASLTAFYLWVSAGGALGGLFVGALAPSLFDAYYELPLALALGWIALLCAFARDALGWLHTGASAWRRGAVALLSGVAFLVAARVVFEPWPHLIEQERSFFGVLRVREQPLRRGGVLRLLTHGTTLHGAQRTDLERRPTTYFGVHTGIGLLFALRDPDVPWRVGVLGLGVGTLAAYGQPGDTFHFSEIDPEVVRMARAHFTFLEQSRAETEVVVGDGRLALEAERFRDAPPYELLILDAYSGDAMPVHLLTLEAVELYASRVTEDGLLAFNVSNRYFDLAPLVARLGAEVGLEALVLQSPHVPLQLSNRSTWVVLARQPAWLLSLAHPAQSRWQGLGAKPEQYSIVRIRAPGASAPPLWTDDHSDLLSVLRRSPRDATGRKQP